MPYYYVVVYDVDECNKKTVYRVSDSARQLVFIDLARRLLRSPNPHNITHRVADCMMFDELSFIPNALSQEELEMRLSNAYSTIGDTLCSLRANDINTINTIAQQIKQLISSDISTESPLGAAVGMPDHGIRAGSIPGLFGIRADSTPDHSISTGGCIPRLADAYGNRIGGCTSDISHYAPAEQDCNNIHGGTNCKIQGTFNVIHGGSDCIVEGKDSVACGQKITVTGDRSVGFGRDLNVKGNDVFIAGTGNARVECHNDKLVFSTNAGSLQISSDGIYAITATSRVRLDVNI